MKLNSRVFLHTIFSALLIVVVGSPCYAIPRAATNVNVNFSFPTYNPSSVTIHVGDSVTWIGDFEFHPLQQVSGATSDTGVSGGFSYSGPNSSFSHTFSSPGTFYYRCTVHGIASQGGGMRGSVTVQEVASPTPTPHSTASGTPTPQATSSHTPTPAATATPNSCQSKPTKVTHLVPRSGFKTKQQSVSLTWHASRCATKYKVTFRKDAKNHPVFKKKTVTDPIYITGKLAKKHTYFWAVSACNGFGCSASTTSKYTIRK